MRSRMVRITRLGVAAALLVLAAGPGSARAQKQTVVIYTAIENEQITEYKKAYEKALPNIDVKMLRLSTGDISARFMAEKDNMQADVIWGVGATNMLIFKNAGLLEPYAPEGPRAHPAALPRQGEPAELGRDRHLHVGVLLQHRGGQEAQPAEAGVVGRPREARLQGARRDAEPGLVGHRLPVGRLDPPAAGGGRGVEVPRRDPPEHGRVHEVRLQAVQGRGGRRAGHRRVVRVRRVGDEAQGRPGGDGHPEGGRGLRDGGQRPHQEGREEPGGPSSSWTGPSPTRR